MTNIDHHQESILIVEDSRTQAMMLKEILENAGYNVQMALNGAEALRIAETSTPDLILSDIIMPIMNGFELCRKIKSQPQKYHIPVVFLTALLTPEDIIKGLECGADGYLIKTYNSEYLLSRIINIIGNKQEYTNHQIADNVEFQYEGKEFTISSNPIQIINLLLSTYDSAIHKNLELTKNEQELTSINKDLEQKIQVRKQELKVQLTERISAEKVLRESENKFRDLIDNAPVWMYISTFKGQLKFVNEAFCRLPNYDSQDELLHVKQEALYRVPGTLEKINEKLISHGEIVGFKVDLVSREGTSRHVLLSAKKDNNDISGMILDITERKEAEERARNYRRELVIAKKKAEQSEKLKNSFLANMSNDILTPLNTLMGLSELISKDELPGKKLNEYTIEINKNGKSIMNLVDNIIDVAKHESGEVAINLSECKINQLLLDMFADYEKFIQKQTMTGIELRLKRAIKDKDFTILSEPYRIKQVLSNLLSNAVNCTDSGHIEFGYTIPDKETSRDGKINLIFYVKDTGTGIPDDKKDSIFDRFRNIETSENLSNRGTGIGLPLSRAYVKLLGGKMWFQSVMGEGSTFYFSLPCQITNDDKHIQEMKVPEVTRLKSRDKMEILVAEDSDSNYFLIETMLSRENYRLIWAKNGKEAVELFRDNPDIDLILMDLRMPVMTGYEAISEIKKLNQDVPVIIQTAYAREEDKEKILASDCTDYITKPIDSDKLIQMIHTISISK